VSPKTLTAPLTDRSMWRRLLRVVRPDSGAGDHDLFIWTGALYEHVAGDHIEEQEDGSLEVTCRGKRTHLTKKDAHAFRLATSSPYRARHQPPDKAFALKLASLREQQHEKQGPAR
jgi:hypothetical protein